jgi:hypothetical protein
VTAADVAEKIFGPNTGTSKGKSTRKAPNAVKKDFIEMPEETKEKHRKVTLCVASINLFDSED